jgi:hypothetical protein
MSVSPATWRVGLGRRAPAKRGGTKPGGASAGVMAGGALDYGDIAR